MDPMKTSTYTTCCLLFGATLLVTAVEGQDLELLRQPGVYDRVHATGKKIKDALERICAENQVPAKMCGENVVFDVYFTDKPAINYRDGLLADGQMMARFNAGLLERGILKGTQKFYPSMVHTEEDVERTIAAFEEVIPELRAQ